MKKYVGIGDIHGHHTELLDLMWQLPQHGVDFEHDTLVFLGDYVDGGPDSLEVVMFLQEMQKRYPHWVFLRGNHEDLMKEAMARGPGTSQYLLWWWQGGEATLKSFGNASLRNQQYVRTWLFAQPTLYQTDHYVFVHAGLKPGILPEYTSEDDRVWIRDQFIDSDYDWGKRVIYGHTPTPNNEPLVMKNKIGIDTLPRESGKLTAVILEEDGVADPVFVFAEATNKTGMINRG